MKNWDYYPICKFLIFFYWIESQPVIWNYTQDNTNTKCVNDTVTIKHIVSNFVIILPQNNFKRLKNENMVATHTMWNV